MTKINFILFLIIGSFQQVCAQADTINRIDSLNLKYGHWRIYGNDPKNKGKGFADTSVVEEGRYIKGKKVGVWKTNYPNSKRKTEVEFKNNRPNGKFTIWYESGCIQEIGTWRNTHYIDEFKSYWENGVVRQEKFYNSNGKVEGKVIYRYINGQIELEYNAVNGIEVGKLYRYYPNGDLKQEINYKDGLSYPPNSILPMKNPDVDLKKFETDCNGNINGLINQKPATFDQNEYRYGKLWKGKKYIYDKNGLLIKIELYENGKKTGEGILLGNDPVIDTTGIQKSINDDSDCGGPCKTCDGYSKIYNNKKQLCKDGEFKNGKLWNGKWYKYTEEGLILRVEIYKNGKYVGDGQLD